MGATSLQDDAQQRRAAQILDRLVVGDRVLAVLDDGELVVMVRGAPDRRLDRAGPLIRPSLADRVIDLLHGASTESVLERSEEHTSELQSRGHLVCRLLLEKKNTENNSE